MEAILRNVDNGGEIQEIFMKFMHYDTRLIANKIVDLLETR